MVDLDTVKVVSSGKIEPVEKMNFLTRFFQNVSALLIGQVIAFIFGFFQLIYLARVLGPESFGLMNYALVIMSYVTVFSSLGLPLAGTRKIAHDRGFKSILFWNIISIRLTLSVVLILITIPVLFVMNNQLSDVIIQFLFLLTVIPTILIPDWIYNGLEKMAINSLVKVIIACSAFFLSLVFVHTSDDLILVPLIQGFSLFIAVTIGYIPIHHEILSKPVEIKPERWPKCISSSLSIGISGILSVIIANIDTFILGFLVSSLEIGYYTASSRITNSFITIMGLIFISIFPALCRSLGNKPTIFSSLSSIIISWIFFLEIPVCMVLSWNADLIIDVIYHSQYSISAGIWKILVWYLLPVTLCSVYGWSFWAVNRDYVYVKVISLNLLTLIPMIAIGVTLWGIAGATVGMVTGAIISIFYHYYPLRKELPFPCKKSLIFVLFAVFSYFEVYSLMHFTNIHPILCQISALCIFVLLVIGCKLVSINDIRRIKKIISG